MPKKSVHLCKTGSIVVPTRLQALAVALIWLLPGSVRRIISRGSLPRRNPLLSTLVVCTRKAEIVLGVLVEVFRGDAVSANRGLARKDDVTLKNLVGAAADSDVGIVAVEGTVALRCSLLLGLVPIVMPTRGTLT